MVQNMMTVDGILLFKARRLSNLDTLFKFIVILKSFPRNVVVLIDNLLVHFLSVFFFYEMLLYFFLENFHVHSKIEGKRQRCPMHLYPDAGTPSPLPTSSVRAVRRHLTIAWSPCLH